MTLTHARIEELRRLEAEATKGPWLNGERILATDKCDALNHEEHADIYRVTPDGNCTVACATFDHADAELVVALRSHATELLSAADEANRLRVLLTEARHEGQHQRQCASVHHDSSPCNCLLARIDAALSSPTTKAGE